MTGTNFSSWYNQSEGTFVVGADFIGQGAANVSPFAISANLTGYSDWMAVSRQFSGRLMSYQLYAASVTQANFTNGSAITDNSVVKMAMAYATNNVGGSTNGATAGTDSSATIPTMSLMFIGREQNTSDYFSGHIRSIAYYNTRLPNATLQALTT